MIHDLQLLHDSDGSTSDFQKEFVLFICVIYPSQVFFNFKPPDSTVLSRAKTSVTHPISTDQNFCKE